MLKIVKYRAQEKMEGNIQERRSKTAVADSA